MTRRPGRGDWLMIAALVAGAVLIFVGLFGHLVWEALWH